MGKEKKCTKAASKWQDSWTKFRMRPSRKGQTYVFCNVCQTDFLRRRRWCPWSKASQLTWKLQGTNVDWRTSLPSQVSLKQWLPDSSTLYSRSRLWKLRCFFVKFIAEHNLSFRSADHFGKLVKVMFPDSKIASSSACSCTKTAAVVNHAMALELNEVVFNACRSLFFVMEVMTTLIENTLGSWWDSGMMTLVLLSLG